MLLNDPLKPGLYSAPIHSAGARRYLQDYLVKKCHGNPRYSLRSMARQLHVESSALSKIMRGKRKITYSMFQKVVHCLGITPHEVDNIVGNNEESNSKYNELSQDAFAVISNWYHFAILDLSEIKGFEWRAQWIAAKLGMTSNEVHAALERLERVGLIKRTKSGYTILSKQNTTIGNQVSTASLRLHQKQLLQKAIESLENTPLEKRENSSISMAIDSHKIEAAVKWIAKFRRTFCSNMEKGTGKDSVYQLVVAFFPLTQIGENK